jgi:hypothetical protein
MMMNDQEALRIHMGQATSGLTALFKHSLKSVGEQEGVALINDLGCGRAELLFKTKFSLTDVTVSGAIIYADGREVPFLNATMAAPLPASRDSVH